MKTYLMLKDTPVLEIEGYTCKILDYERLPISLRYTAVNFDDVMHGWTETRTMSIGKTHAKKILAGFKISQSNPYKIAKLFHFTSLSDCYWIKGENENLTWKDVSLFQNDLEKTVTATALLGAPSVFPRVSPKIHTPELTVQGMAAKAWIREGNTLYLYKVGKKELAASKILDFLDIPHVHYEAATDQELLKISDEAHLKKILEQQEKVVKCAILSSEERSILPWEDFQMYCSYHELNEFDYIRQHCPREYYSMQIADYILGNEDRHGANWGFFMNNETGQLLDLYPLMDHDHAFSDEECIPSQTSECDETLRDAALHACGHVSLKTALEMDKPEELTEDEWLGVVERYQDLFL